MQANLIKQVTPDDDCPTSVEKLVCIKWRSVSRLSTDCFASPFKHATFPSPYLPAFNAVRLVHRIRLLYPSSAIQSYAGAP
jgi:hypothetical protein